MSDIKITYRGWPSHFCAAHSCSFRLNTLVECGDIRIVVSTVGVYRPGGPEGFPTEIGLNRFYETMAFHATWDEPYWDANVRREIAFDAPWAIGHVEYTADSEANKMHVAVVAEIVKRLEAGETFPTKREEEERNHP